MTLSLQTISIYNGFLSIACMLAAVALIAAFDLSWFSTERGKGTPLEAITLAGAFATTVGLLSSYKAERRAESDDEFMDFHTWLAHNNHNEVIE